MNSDNQTSADRRLFQRFSARYPAKFEDSREDFGDKIYLRDASAQGVRLRTKERLFINDSVTIEVTLPDGYQPMHIRGQVIWSKSDEPNFWDVGLNLHDTKLMRMSRLFKFVESLPSTV